MYFETVCEESNKKAAQSNDEAGPIRVYIIVPLANINIFNLEPRNIELVFN